MSSFHYCAAEGLLVSWQILGVGSSACKGEVFDVATLPLLPIANDGAQSWLMDGIAD